VTHIAFLLALPFLSSRRGELVQFQKTVGVANRLIERKGQERKARKGLTKKAYYM
jgi:hypothetical protein